MQMVQAIQVVLVVEAKTLLDGKLACFEDSQALSMDLYFQALLRRFHFLQVRKRWKRLPVLLYSEEYEAQIVMVMLDR